MKTKVERRLEKAYVSEAWLESTITDLQKKGARLKHSLWQCARGRKREVCLHDRIFEQPFSWAYGIEWSKRNRNNVRNIRKRPSEKIKVQQSRALFICTKYSVLISFNTVKCLKRNQCKCPSFFIIIPDNFTREVREETNEEVNECEIKHSEVHNVKDYQTFC